VRSETPPIEVGERTVDLLGALVFCTLRLTRLRMLTILSQPVS
jgi:hypothetical protein